MQIRRILPSPQRQMIGPFIFMDQGGPATLPNLPDSGVAEHPHAGLSTFTYLLAGHGLHRDSAGHSAIIESGDIALMSAGSGITHEEGPDPNDGSATLQNYFVQMWLALPDEYEDMSPQFELHKATALPLISTAGGQVRLLMGSAWGETAPTTCFVETVFADIELPRHGIMNIESTCAERAIYVLEGDAAIDGVSVEQHTLVLLKAGGRPEISSVEGGRAILIGGEPFGSPRFIGGSFVASSKEKLRLRSDQYKSGMFPSIKA
ncbi:MAG: pirin family protein [Pseudomonadota bacterium]